MVAPGLDARQEFKRLLDNEGKWVPGCGYIIVAGTKPDNAACCEQAVRTAEVVA
jgi:hypothetical protein